jgi:hypothetical protein
MLACRTTGNATLQLLAAANRADAIFDTGNNAFTVHQANGSDWYFSTARSSWGFALLNDGVFKSTADISNTGTVADRLSWHIAPAAGGGYRCGANEGLNLSGAFERIVYQSAPDSVPIPTLSEWATILLSLLLLGFGLGTLRGRNF